MDFDICDGEDRVLEPKDNNTVITFKPKVFKPYYFKSTLQFQFYKLRQCTWISILSKKDMNTNKLKHM